MNDALRGTVFIDSFSGKVADLPKGRRTEMDILAVLVKHPLVSTFDMSEIPWIRDMISVLESRGLIESQPERYPWHQYKLSAAALNKMKGIEG